MSLTAQSAARKDRRTAQNGPTLDHRHFGVMRTSAGKSFTLLPA